MEIEIRNYDAAQETLWDDFVLKLSVNGTFLQTRKFLNYHYKGKFEDCSLMAFNKGNLIAVCPAHTLYEDKNKVFSSHSGTTFGGIIISEKWYAAEKTICIIDALENHIRETGYQRITYKITSDLFCRRRSDLLQYCLYYRQYQCYDELNLYADLNEYGDDIISNFAQGKRTNIHNCIKSGLELRQLQNDDDIEIFYSMLCKTLDKYSLKPVHTLNELLEFKNVRLKEECEFYGAFLGDRMVSGSMMFLFNNVNVAHTQYLCALSEYNKLSPMSYMYYAMIREMKLRNFKLLSWGITSEHKGIELNYGLTNSKEDFGSKHSVSRIYYKVL